MTPTKRPPWESDDVRIVPLADGLCGIRYTRGGFPVRVVVWEGYVWDPEREAFPGVELWSMLHRKELPTESESGDVAAKCDELSRKKWPTLVDHLTQTKWPDGTPREVSKLSVWHDGGTFKIMVRDVASGLVLFVASPTVTKLFDVLEANLADSNADWRRDKHQDGKGGTKKNR